MQMLESLVRPQAYTTDPSISPLAANGGMVNTLSAIADSLTSPELLHDQHFGLLSGGDNLGLSANFSITADYQGSDELYLPHAAQAVFHKSTQGLGPADCPIGGDPYTNQLPEGPEGALIWLPKPDDTVPISRHMLNKSQTGELPLQGTWPPRNNVVPKIDTLTNDAVCNLLAPFLLQDDLVLSKKLANEILAKRITLRDVLKSGLQSLDQGSPEHGANQNVQDSRPPLQRGESKSEGRSNIDRDLTITTNISV